jgi:hypothetical protein
MQASCEYRPRPDTCDHRPNRDAIVDAPADAIAALAMCRGQRALRPKLSISSARLTQSSASRSRRLSEAACSCVHL